jgi:hypothetical protein
LKLSLFGVFLSQLVKEEEELLDRVMTMHRRAALGVFNEQKENSLYI